MKDFIITIFFVLLFCALCQNNSHESIPLKINSSTNVSLSAKNISSYEIIVDSKVDEDTKLYITA